MDEKSDNIESGSQKTEEFLVKMGANMNEINRVKRRYPMKATRYYLSLIRGKDDPIWKQCVPDIEEIRDTLNVEDPLKEEEHTPVPYLVHKYPDRVLLLVSSKCAMYCRFCTRKRKVGRIQQIPMEDIMKAIDYIGEHPEVRDVIVSGGDPLMRTDKELETILSRLRSIPHVEIIRIGTRMPCVNPVRVTKRLASMLAKYHPVFINIHFNHPSEITKEAKEACAILSEAGIPLGNQTVLLKGVNDDPDVMKELMRELLKIRVRPYYIYQCDLVKGVEHFRTEVECGIEIMKQIQGFTSGLALPHFVIDGPGGKVPISPQYVKEITKDQIIVTNYLDQMYSYPGLNRTATKKLSNKRVNTIGIAYNLKKMPKKGERIDKYAEYDDLDTIDAIRRSFENNGYEVKLLEADVDFFEKLKSSEVDFVFNIAEGIHGESRESHIPSVLEMLNIPYSGSGVLTQAITLNKSRKKEILNYYDIPTPRFQLFRNINQKLDPTLRFPLIVKPDAEGSSVGITNDSLVFDIESLRKQVGKVLKEYDQNALAEEYLDGREFTVSLMGNGKPHILPIIEVDFSHLPENIHHFDSYEAKWVYDDPVKKMDAIMFPTDLKPRLKANIEKVARKTFQTLGIVDMCRIDIRLDQNEVPHVLDVNALPGLMPDPNSNSRFTRSAYRANMTYEDIIMTIFKAALKRYNLAMAG
ncbi:MAG: KamA family radical SAM protein [Candidatus Thermoplasmatota archaeon]|nr:KamA family radical SAM protein [Candidatus Thermoplasmatota archaeon]